jgi:hypothetical protein
MPFNGSGSFSPYTPGNPVITGTVISSTAFNATMTDIAAGLTNAITRDGQSPPSANLPMASNKLTGLGAGTVSGDSLRFQQLFSQGAPASLPSAATVDIGGQNSVAVEISGTTGITSFGTNYNGPRYIRFAGALLLTHNATTLNLPGAANITTAAGDTCAAYPNLAGNGWNIVQYQRASGAALVIADGSITAPKLSGAQTGSAPIYGCRAWVVFDGSLAGTNAPTAGGNVTNVTRTGTGQYTVNLTTAMPSASYAVVSGGNEKNTSALGGYGPEGAPTTTTFNVVATDGAGAYTNGFTRMRFAIFG